MSKNTAITAASTLDDVKFNLRVSSELYRWLTEYAHEQGRSTNAQLVQLIKEERARLQRGKPDVSPSPPADDDQV